MKKKGESFFWTSFSDLMTSLFFIMLVLYVLTYIMLKKKERELVNTVEDLKHKLEVYDLVEQNLKPLKQDVPVVAPHNCCSILCWICLTFKSAICCSNGTVSDV